jgi:hypothetical protein
MHLILRPASWCAENPLLHQGSRAPTMHFAPNLPPRPHVRRAILGALPLALLVVACGAGDVADKAATGPDGGANSATVAPRPNADCPEDAWPSVHSCTLHDSLGIFVSGSTGDDSNFGTMDRPVRTIAEGVRRASIDGRRVYVCNGTYDETIVVQRKVSMFGNIECDAKGARPAMARSVVRAAQGSPALVADGIVAPTAIVGFHFTTTDAARAVPAQSAIAARLVRSPGVVLANDRFVAGKGGDGGDGRLARALVEVGSPAGQDNAAPDMCNDYPLPAAVNRCLASHGEPAGGRSTCAFEDGTPAPTNLHGMPGGHGGRGAVSTMNAVNVGGSPVLRASPITAESDGQATNDVETAPGGKVGGPAALQGRDGAPGMSGPSGANVGSFADGAYVPADGIAGENGGPGQGGGGGAGSRSSDPTQCAAFKTCYAAPGSGGGAGGCPGLSGEPGHGGGASIALVLVDSPITIAQSVVESASGGRGGRGTYSSRPGVGGNPGANRADGHGRGGAPGGHGGWGGTSGHGGGGPSIGILVVGAEPTLDDTSIHPGPGGPGLGATELESPDGYVQRIAGSADGLSVKTLNLR